MHKTLYIDIDEEITSIIDRVRKSAANEIIVIAPKRALLLQSLVNLKLLKKEVGRRKKKLMIVTQDKIGKKLIEKAGILVQGKMDSDLEDYPDETEYQARKKEVVIDDEELTKELAEEELKIGSDQYFDEPLPVPKVEKEAEGTSENIGKITFGEVKEKTAAGKGAGGAGKSIARQPKEKKTKDRFVKVSDIVAGPGATIVAGPGATIVAGPGTRSKKVSRVQKDSFQKVAAKSIPKTGFSQKPEKFGRELQRKTEKFFGFPASEKISQAGAFRRGKEEKIIKTSRVAGKTARYLLVFTITFFLLASFAAAYFFLPRATIAVYLKSQEKTVSASIEANIGTNSVDESQNIVPAVLEQIIKEKTEEIEASGRKSGGGKATGSVVIYNEFSSDSQPLVATTRLETSDGKIFRITKGVIVPGMTKVGTETKPGAIEVTVEADKPGETYNIDPTTFKIPGFASGPKYDKFYAKSAKTMTGGAEGESPIVTSQDVSKAKEKLMVEAKKEAAEELKNSLPKERKFFEDAITTELVEAVPSASVGTQTEKFSYTIKVKAITLSFSENGVKEIMKNSLTQEGESINRVDFENPLNYLLSESDPGKKFIKFEAKTDLNLAGGVDMENFKKGALGKNAAELESLIKSYPLIQKADINFWPFFVTRVPMNEKRVKIEIK